MQRAVAVPIPADNIGSLVATSGHLYYMTLPDQTIEGPLSGEHSALHVFDMDKRKDKTLTSSLAAYCCRPTAKPRSSIPQDGKFALLDVSAGAEAKPKDLDTSHMLMRVDPKAEWDEMFHMAWRLDRDFFVNPKMNGMDWDAILAKYPSCCHWWVIARISTT